MQHVKFEELENGEDFLLMGNVILKCRKTRLWYGPEPLNVSIIDEKYQGDQLFLYISDDAMVGKI